MWGNVHVPAVVAEVVAIEGPIAERLLARRLAQAWSLRRAPSGLAAFAPTVLARIPEDRRPILRDGFFWPPALDRASWRAYRVPDPADSDTRREIDDIPVEEIANAVDDLVARYGRMPREDLARAVAKRFGYRGLTRGVASSVERGIAHAEARASSHP
jgi:hypothetical protein